jgi:hypothetical protein
LRVEGSRVSGSNFGASRRKHCRPKERWHCDVGGVGLKREMTQQSKGSRTKERWLIKFGGVSTGGLDLRPTSPAGLRLWLDPLLEILVKWLASDTHIQ